MAISYYYDHITTTFLKVQDKQLERGCSQVTFFNTQNLANQF